ncbi:hypothetical protein GWO43_11050 [candidate division KSB1 bacterium]|nr:hypothetical protein [candidate division KSB1 bacterium]NIR70354.1 hypothetical protein [candidate division KSB1 bacterium]NIS24478.1 hypothetical protein [candidate division KSB1 bacterium]NIT71406.1 hypothetical protein [candidate division KSB1 bacterium]NIU23541.1 hypothetical protein [candidate division KSB1 bacterium]
MNKGTTSFTANAGATGTSLRQELSTVLSNGNYTIQPMLEKSTNHDKWQQIAKLLRIYL